MANIDVVKVLSERRFKAGYVVRHEWWACDGDEPTEMHAAYSTIDGSYIGRPQDAFYLCRKRGIRPQRRLPGATVATIGFCEREQKWYGWSHRAIFGFGVGHRVKTGDVASRGRVGYRAKTLRDAKRLASAFAADVG